MYENVSERKPEAESTRYTGESARNRRRMWVTVSTIALSIAGSLVTMPVGLAAVTELEGSAGGGIVPWALTSSGRPTVSTTWVDTGDYTLSSVSLNGSPTKWLELSVGHMSFDTAGVGLGQIDVNVFGAKFNALAMKPRQPALSIGAQYKTTDAADSFLESVGADDAGLDAYLAVTKVWNAGGKKVLLNGTVRATKANQIGILGFGSNTEDGYSAQFEGSVGVFLNDSTILGLEYRTKPDNINGLREQDWADLFFAYFPSKKLSLVAAYASLGDIAAEANANNGGFAGEDQRGLYLQVQVSF